MIPEHARLEYPTSLRAIVAAAPTKTLLAAGFLGLMWGPILATVMNAVDQVKDEQAAQAEADRLDPLPAQRLDPLRTRAETAASATATDVQSTSSGIEADDAALDRLKGLTRHHQLSNPVQDASPALR